MAVKLSELLDHQPFGLRLVTGSAPTNRIVRGVTPIEVPEPGRWLAPGYLVMTNGMALRGNVEKQQRFTEDVHRAGAPALGMWLNAPFKIAPPAMVHRAEELGLPMFTAPYELPSREIISFVMRANLKGEAQHLARAMRAQDYLLEALDEKEPMAALVVRVHTVLRASAAAFSPVGEVIATAGSPPVDAMWAAVCGQPEVSPLGRDWLFTTTALVGDVPFAHLAVRLHDEPRSTNYAGSVARFAGRVIQMIGLAGYARAEQERASRLAVLHDLLDTGIPDRALLERLHLLGFRPDAKVRIVVADTAPRVSSAEAVSSVSALFARQHIVALLDVDGRELLALVECSSSERAMLADLGSGGGARLDRVGVGLSASLEDGVQQTHREARIALLRARRERNVLVWFDDIGLADKLLSYVPADRLDSAAKVLAPLQDERPDLLATLTAYLERDCSVRATANALHLHPNSLRYRLSVIERLLGRSLSSLDTLLELTLAMRIDAVADNGATNAQRPEPVRRSGS